MPTRKFYVSLHSACDRLAKKRGVESQDFPHWTPHDFRHLFSTKLLSPENQKHVSITTAAKWLGHRDGGTPRYRMLATATPIKNRLPDLFSLMWWAAGGLPNGHPGFPWRDTPGDRDKFGCSFMVMERNLTKEHEAKRQGKNRKFIRATAKSSNREQLWRYSAPLNTPASQGRWPGHL